MSAPVTPPASFIPPYTGQLPGAFPTAFDAKWRELMELLPLNQRAKASSLLHELETLMRSG